VPDRDEIIGSARSSFAFLQGRPAEVVDDFWLPTLVYPIGPVTVEVELDRGDQIVHVLIGRTVNGHRPPGYYRHDGRLMRVQFTDALDGGGEPDRAAARRVRAVAGTSGPAAMVAQIHEPAAILREMTDRLADDRRLFTD